MKKNSNINVFKGLWEDFLVEQDSNECEKTGKKQHYEITLHVHNYVNEHTRKLIALLRKEDRSSGPDGALYLEYTRNLPNHLSTLLHRILTARNAIAATKLSYYF